jgi:hypothetical protein
MFRVAKQTNGKVGWRGWGGGGYIYVHNIRYGLSTIYGKGWQSSGSAIKVTDLDLGGKILLLMVNVGRVAQSV